MPTSNIYIYISDKKKVIQVLNGMRLNIFVLFQIWFEKNLSPHSPCRGFAVCTEAFLGCKEWRWGNSRRDDGWAPRCLTDVADQSALLCNSQDKLRIQHRTQSWKRAVQTHKRHIPLNDRRLRMTHCREHRRRQWARGSCNKLWMHESLNGTMVKKFSENTKIHYYAGKIKLNHKSIPSCFVTTQTCFTKNMSLFWTLVLFMFLKEVSSAHQSYIYLMKNNKNCNIVKY